MPNETLPDQDMSETLADETLAALRDSAQAEIDAAANPAALDQVRVALLGMRCEASTYAAQLLGWRSERGLKEIVESAYRWHLTQLETAQAAASGNRA